MMADSESAGLVDECLAALETVGEVERWVQRQSDGSLKEEVLAETFRDVTRRLLQQKPPETAFWEQLLFASAVRSSQANGERCLASCKAAVAELIELVDSDEFEGVDGDRIVTLASALTLALTAQRKLRQTIECASAALVAKFESKLPEIATRCQGIWQRRAQMSGADSLYVWDTRRDEWRLSQDFKPYRP